MVSCPDVDHMEDEVQFRFQVEEEGEEQGIRETHGEEQRVKEQTLSRTTWMTMEMT